MWRDGGVMVRPSHFNALLATEVVTEKHFRCWNRLYFWQSYKLAAAYDRSRDLHRVSSFNCSTCPTLNNLAKKNKKNKSRYLDLCVVEVSSMFGWVEQAWKWSLKERKGNWSHLCVHIVFITLSNHIITLFRASCAICFTGNIPTFCFTFNSHCVRVLLLKPLVYDVLNLCCEAVSG